MLAASNLVNEEEFHAINEEVAVLGSKDPGILGLFPLHAIMR